jgi:hypothetical protein
MRCTGKRLSWKRALTDEEIVELGLKNHAEVKRLRKEYEKAAKLHEKEASKAKDSESELSLTKPGNAPAAEPKPPVISLRKIFTGLPPHAKRLTSTKGVDISRFAKGDLLLVPLNQSGAICKSTESTYREIWYRITAINTSGQVEMQLAEFKEIKCPSEKELKEGKRKRLQPEQEWLASAFQQQPGSDAVIARLLQRTRADDLPSHPPLRTPGLAR